MKEHLRRILVDCDGVLADFIGPVYKRLGRDPKSHTTWDFATAWGISPEEMAFASEPGFCRNLEPLAAVGASLGMLRGLGEVVIVTSHPTPVTPHWYHERLQWLYSYGVLRKEVIFTERKDLIRGDVLIDDGPHNLAAAHPHMITICIDAPYNQGALCDHRVANIYEAAVLLRDMWNASTA